MAYFAGSIAVSAPSCSWKERSKFSSSCSGIDSGRAPNQGANSENVGNLVTHANLAAGAASKVGQTAKARSGYRVQSLPKGRDRQCRRYLKYIAAPESGQKCSPWPRSFISTTDQVLKMALRHGWDQRATRKV